MKRKKILLIIAVFLLLASTLSWAATSSGQNISVSSGSTAAAGGVSDVTALSSSFTITQGRAQRISGVELYKVDLGSASYRNNVKFFLTLLSPEDMGQVLSNPHAFIQVEVCYKVTSGEDYTLGDGTKVKKTSASGMITAESADLVLFPTMGGDTADSDTYYVLGSITVPGGVPAGQQTQLTELDFYLNVRR